MLETGLMWWICLGAAFLALLSYVIASLLVKKKEEPVVESDSIKPVAETSPVEASPIEATPIEAFQPTHFPGEDAIASQLDLARAYIEMGKQELAKGLLERIQSTASEEQAKIIEGLLSEIK